MNKLKHVVVVAAFMVVVDVQAVTIPFDEVTWEVKQKPDYCSMSAQHNGKGYTLRFEQRAGSALNMILMGRSVVSMGPQVTVNLDNSIWSQRQRTADQALLMSVPTQHEDDQLMAMASSGRFYQAFKSGWWITYKGQASAQTLTFPSTGIQVKSVEFDQCVATLPLVGFDDAHSTAITFSNGQIKLSYNQLKSIYNISDLINKDSDISKVYIDGYTDNIGSEVANIKLSKKRASEVAYAMVLNGVRKDMIRITGQGERNPLRSNATQDGRDQNRRVEIRLIKKQ